MLEAGDSVVWYYSKYGDPAPTDQLSVSCEVVGQAKDGSQQTWAQPTTIQVKEGSTAAELSEQVFKQAGIGANTGTGSYGWFLNSLTSPFDEDVKLSTEQVDASTWKFWQFFVNGKKANVGAGNYTLKAGDKVSWVYGSDGTMPGQAEASLQIIGVDSGGNVQTWAPAADYTMVDTATVADATELAFKQSGISANYGTGAWAGSSTQLHRRLMGERSLGTPRLGLTGSSLSMASLPIWARARPAEGREVYRLGLYGWRQAA